MIHLEIVLQDKTYQNQPKTIQNSAQPGHHPLKTSTETIKSSCDKACSDPQTGEDQSRNCIQKCLQRISPYRLIGEPYIENYLNDQRCRGCRPNTIQNSAFVILLFFKHLQEIGQTLESFTRKDVSAFVEHEQDRGLKANTVFTRLRSLYAFLEYLVQRDVLSPDILKRKLRIKVPDPLPRAIDPEDIRALLAVIKKTRDRAMILLLLRTGMRIGELLNTRIEDVHLNEKRIDIIEAGKTRTGRVVYLSQDAEAVLKIWFSERDLREPYLFYSVRHDRDRLSYTGAKWTFDKYVEKSGLSNKGYSLHCLRHTFASELLNAGMRLECLQPILGHRCIEMTRRYARLTDNTRREEYFAAMDKIEKGAINGSYQCNS
jgi:integrase/recombinase XerD